jgi:2-dehydro-3-deoxygluconokinase
MYNWDLIFKDISWFHWTGITPALSENLANICLNAVKVAKERNITISCDLNYRNKLWNYGKTPIEVMPKLIKNCNILIGSEFNIRKMLDIALSDEQIPSDRIQTERNQKIMKKVMKTYPNLEFVGFTMRNLISSSHNTFSGLLYDGNEIYSSPKYDIDFIVDRVGAGDAFNAGLIYGLLKFKDDLQKVLDFAVAAAALKHSIEGDFNLVSKSEVEKLMKGHSSGLISR